MSLVTIGLQGLSHVSTETDWDPRHGPSTVEVYTGLEGDCKVAAAQFNKGGFRATTRQLQGPEHQLRVYFPDGRDGRKIFVETWERVTEWAQVDIRNNPKLWAAVVGEAGSPDLAADLLNSWHHDIRKALKDGTALSDDVEGEINPVHLELYKLMARGTEVYEVKRFVLRRRRTFAPKDAAGSIMDPVEKVYTTSALISEFAIPPIIASRLPADPPADYTPSGTVWAWKARVDETRSVLSRNAGRTDEILDWVFAAWSTLLYDVKT